MAAVKFNSGKRHFGRVVRSHTNPITPSPNHSMFWRTWLKSLAVKRPQSALAFAALALGATVVSLLLNVYGDARRKMQGEFRAYGPNVVAAPAPGAAAPNSTVSGAGLIDSGTVARLDAHLQEISRSSPPSAAGAVSVPVLYAVVSAGSPTRSDRAPGNVVAVGADWTALHALNPAWKLNPGANTSLSDIGPDQCVLGARVAELLQLKAGDSIRLASSAASQSAPDVASDSDRHSQRQPLNSLPDSAAAGRQAFIVGGRVSTGGPEDDQVFVPLGALQHLMGLSGEVSLVEMRLPGAPAEVEAAVRDLRRAFPSIEVRPVREIVQSEGKVLSTIQALLWALAALIVGVVVLCVMATVTTIMLHRRKEVAVMKALGASDRAVFALLLAEIVALGIAGGLVGFTAGTLLARRLGVDLFGVPLNTDWSTALPVLAATVLAAALPALLPVSTVRSIDPARALKGE